MKLIFSYIILGILACGGGIGAAYLYHGAETSSTEEMFYTQQWVISDAATLFPIASVATKNWEIGKIDPSEDYTYDFVVTNTGTSILEIWLDEQPDSPLEIDLKQKVEIDLKKSYPITVRLDGEKVTQDIDTTIVVQTNQPENKSFELKITAQAPGN